MNRLFALIGFSALAVLVVVFYCGFYAGLWCALAALLGVAAFFVLFFLYKFGRLKCKISPALLIVCVTIIISVFYSLFYNVFNSEKLPPNLNEQNVKVTATLTDEPYISYGYWYHQMQGTRAAGSGCSFNFVLRSGEKIDAEPYDTVEFEAYFLSADSSYYKSQNIEYRAYAGPQGLDYTVTHNNSKPLYARAIEVREALAKAIDDAMVPEFSGFCKAIVLGVESDLDPVLEENFRKTGVSHIVVVSGQHLTLLVGYISLLFAKARRKRYIATAVMIAIVLAYMAVTAFSPSIVRAGIVMIIWLCGDLFSKRIDPINSLGAAAAILMAFNPNSAGDVGLLLSFASTGGILLFATKISNWLQSKLLKRSKLTPQTKAKIFLHKAVAALCVVVAVSVAATLGATPVLMLTFGSFSPIGLFANFLLAQISGLAIVFGMLTAVLQLVAFLQPLAALFALAASLVFKYMFFVTEYLCKIPYSFLNIGEGYVYLWLAFVMFFAALLAVLKKPRKYVKITALMCVLVFCGGSFTAWALSASKSQIELIPSAGGNSVIVTSENRSALICLGDGTVDLYRVRDYFESSDNSLDLVIIPAEQNDNFADFLREFKVKNALVAEAQAANFRALDAVAQQDVQTYSGTYNANLWGTAQVEVTQADGKTVYLITTSDYTACILPKSVNLQALPQSFAKADYCTFYEY